MKKVLIFFVLLFIAFTLTAQEFTVVNTCGNCYFEHNNNKVIIKVGDILNGNLVIHTGVAASLILRDGDKNYTIAAVKTGRICDLIVDFSGIKISGTVMRTNVAAIQRTTAQASTASARASDAAADIDICEE